MRFGGTLLNTWTVIVGSLLGLGLGGALPEDWAKLVQWGIGLAVIGVGVSMFLKSKNVLVVVAAIAFGGVMGAAMGIDRGLEGLAEAFRQLLGGEGRFNEGFLTASILYCVGPMTLLGCIEDGVKGKSELLRLKSVLDGITSVFFAAAMGVGVLASAVTVLVFQGILTGLASTLRGVAKEKEYLDEISATGGVMMIAIGVGLAELKSIPAENFLPALFLVPLFVWLWKRFFEGKFGSDEGSDVESGA